MSWSRSTDRPRSPTHAYRADDRAAYERFLGRWTGRFAQVLIDFAGLPGDGPLRDVGCGTGSVAFELRRCSPTEESPGDVSAAYLPFAQARDGGRDIRFEPADAACLPFEAGAFAGATRVA
jgi:ubiquinone/menaquinone biosynthesis C-methylase UbiE